MHKLSEFNVGFPMHMLLRSKSIPSIDKRTCRYLPYVMSQSAWMVITRVPQKLRLRLARTLA